MARGRASGYVLRYQDAPIIMGMVNRGDRDHDIAAWFGVNQGRVAEVKDGTKFGIVAAAPANQLPPKGPPGIKGRRLRKSVESVLAQLKKDEISSKGVAMLSDAVADYDKNER